MRRAQQTPGRPQLRLVPLPRDRAAQTRRIDRSNGRPVAASSREEKIALARRRVEQGFYDRSDVLERIAEGVLRHLRPTPEPKSL